MRIDFDKLLSDYNQSHPLEKLSRAKLAREMVASGIMKSNIAALNLMRYHINGQAKSCDWKLLKFLVRRFKRPGSEIIQWDD